MDLWDRIRDRIRTQNTTQDWVAKKLNMRSDNFRRWLSNKTMMNADEALGIAKVLNTTVEYLLTGENNISMNITAKSIIDDDPNIYPVPILDQRVAAGGGQELIDSAQIIGTLPFLKKMLRGDDPTKAMAVEVRGDSMTGVEMFDGDLVVFVPGAIRGDGIYVLKVNDTLLVKRVEFDEISRKLRIMSENPRYPERVESADGQTVQIIGKVYGWVHAHPY